MCLEELDVPTPFDAAIVVLFNDTNIMFLFSFSLSCVRTV